MTNLSWVWVGLGGFLGANARYLVSVWLNPLRGPLPWGTFVANVTGSALLAVFFAWARRHGSVAPATLLLIGTGFFGAYTTFSTFSNETMAMMQDGRWGIASLYLFGTNSMCLVGVLLGLMIGNRL